MEEGSGAHRVEAACLKENLVSSPIERIRVKLPDAFDARKHTGAILTKVAQAHGEGWEIESIDTAARALTAIRQAQITQVSASADIPEAMVLGLARGTKPSDGDRIAARFEDAHPGYSLTRFDPYLGQATMTRLTEAEVRARGAVAVALGAKVWDVQITSSTGGGFHLGLPSSFVPSKHQGKLTEVAERVVGRPGWFVQTNAAELTAQIVPASPPTFPDMIATPMKALSKDRDRTGFGMQLPPPGNTAGELLTIDWTAQSFALLAGTPGSGKTVAANALIAGAVASGNDLVIVDEFSKRVDFLWAREFTRDGGWGCDSLPAAVASLAMVYEEGQRRASVLAEKGHVNWLDMPASEQFRPVLIVVDEVSALLVTDKVPSGIPKDHPLVREVTETNLLKIKLASLISKIIAEQRFVGMRMVLSTQVTNNNTGVPPSLKAKIGHKILQGVNPSKSARVQAFSDESAVPLVPENVKAGGKVARGVGVADLEGQTPAVYKSYFASTEAYRAHLTSLGVPTSSQPAPTPAQIAAYTPSLDDDGSDDGPPASPLESGSGWGEPDGRDAPAPRLLGAAAAAHTLNE